MDDMDIDHIEVVPETPPDRLVGGNADRRRNLPASGFPKNRNLRDGASKILFEANNNGFRRFSGPVPPSSVSDQIHRNNILTFGLGNPRAVDKGILAHDTIVPSKKTFAQLSASEGGPTASLRAEKTGKVEISSSSHCNAGSPTRLQFANKGKEPEHSSSGFDNKNMATSANFTHRMVGNGETAPTSFRLDNRPSLGRRKRLVRNGCISPLNIAQSLSVGKEKVEPDVQPSITSSHDGTAGRVDLATLNSKGKEVMNSPTTVKEKDDRSSYLFRRNSDCISEIVKDDTNTDRASSRMAEEISRWRSTRNRSTPTSLPSSHENRHKSSKNEVSLGMNDRHPINLDGSPTQKAPVPPENQKVAHRSPELGQVRHRAAVNGLIKRPKQLTSSRNGESSRAASDSPEVVVIDSSGNAQRSRSHLNSEVSVIEVDESSPVARGGESRNQGASIIDAEALAIQMEADEILARELQEQLYNERPGVNMSQMHAHLEMAFQQGYDLPQSFSSRTGRNSSNTRRSSVASSSSSQQTNASLSSTRRVSQSRAPNVNRMSRFRNRFTGRPRASVREIEFPSDMEVEMRLNILEALEAINDGGVDHSLLQTQRDFNENDYEMLLALDDNINHGGASASRINGLPQSTVQSENFDEACAVCLDTPTVGDVIRHLPCLHKFHKDCIDPWLRRKTSCPVCKSSIT